MHYQVFIPGQTGANPNMLDAVGLADHRDGGCQFNDEATGPDGGRGVIVSWPAHSNNQFGYRPD